MNFLESIDVSKNFRNHRALDNVNIAVPEASIFGLLGPNGAGKTTWIRIINQITAPDTGQILLKGRPLQQEDNKLIGYLPEERGLYKKMKVGEQAMYLSQLKGISQQDAKRELKIWFEKFDILDWWDRKVEELSKGMAQKVQFVITIIHKPKLLIFDEPFSGFDPINTELLKDEIKNLRDQGSTIIFSTHNMASVEEICDHIALINNSKVILEGKVKDVKRQFFTHTYSAVLSELQNGFEHQIPSNFKLVESSQDDEYSNLTLKLENDATSTQLINFLNKHGKIHQFNELVPSMNDIFIESVRNNN